MKRTNMKSVMDDAMTDVWDILSNGEYWATIKVKQAIDGHNIKDIALARYPTLARFSNISFKKQLSYYS